MKYILSWLTKYLRRAGYNMKHENLNKVSKVELEFNPNPMPWVVKWKTHSHSEKSLKEKKIKQVRKGKYDRNNLAIAIVITKRKCQVAEVKNPLNAWNGFGSQY